MQDSMAYNETKNYDKNIVKCNDQRRKEKTNNQGPQSQDANETGLFAIVVMTRRIVHPHTRIVNLDFHFGGIQGENQQQ